MAQPSYTTGSIYASPPKADFSIRREHWMRYHLRRSIRCPGGSADTNDQRKISDETDILYFKFTIIPLCHPLCLLLSRLGIPPRSLPRRTLLVPSPNLRRKLSQLAQ